ncbi:MAG: NYN domain-containing protein, partial [Patescibacteria group bacterium]
MDMPLKTNLLDEAVKLDEQGIEFFVPKANFDVEITADSLKETKNYDQIILFSGDGDFAYLLKTLKKLGKRSVVVSGRKSLSGSLIKEADKFVTLERFGEKIPGLFAEKQNPPHGRVLKKCVFNIADLLGLSNYCPVDNSVSIKEGSWTKVVYLKEGMEIAVSDKGGNEAVWDKISKIEVLPEEQVYDIEVDGTHNFIGNDIVAHNTYIGGSASAANLIVSNSSVLGTVSSGFWNGTVIAAQYGGTGQNFSASSGLMNLYSGTASAIATSSLGLLTTNIAEGTNLYWTNDRFDNRLSATTTLPNITTLANLATVGTITSGTWNGTTIAVNKGGTGLTS